MVEARAKEAAPEEEPCEVLPLWLEGREVGGLRSRPDICREGKGGDAFPEARSRADIWRAVEGGDEVAGFLSRADACRDVDGGEAVPEVLSGAETCREVTGGEAPLALAAAVRRALLEDGRERGIPCDGGAGRRVFALIGSVRGRRADMRTAGGTTST